MKTHHGEHRGLFSVSKVPENEGKHGDFCKMLEGGELKGKVA